MASMEGVDVCAVSFCTALPLAVPHISVVLSSFLLEKCWRGLAHSEIYFASASIGGFPVTSDLLKVFWGGGKFSRRWVLHALIVWAPASDIVFEL